MTDNSSGHDITLTICYTMEEQIHEQTNYGQDLQKMYKRYMLPKEDRRTSPQNDF